MLNMEVGFRFESGLAAEVGILEAKENSLNIGTCSTHN